MELLLGKDLCEDNYLEYVERIVNIFKLSTKESSIIFQISINDLNCLIKLSMVKQNGEKEAFRDQTSKCDQNFYDKFVDVLVKKFLEEVKIINKDVVNLDNDNFLTLRLITENNDLFILDGLSENYANHLFNIDGNKEEITFFSNDEMGIGGLKIFTLIIIIFIVILFALIFIFF